MSWLWYLLCGLFVLEALRLRGKLKSLPVLPAGGEGSSSTGYVSLTAPGVVLGDATFSAASGYARSNGFDVLDLVPGDAPALELVRMFHRFEPVDYRVNRIARGYTTGYCLIVRRELLERCGIDEKAGVKDNTDLFRMARVLKKYAIEKAGIAVAPGLRTPKEENGTGRWSVLFEYMRAGANSFLLWQACLLALVAASLLVSIRTGLIVLAVWHAQLLVLYAGGKIRPRDLIQATLFRVLFEVRNFARLCRTRLEDRRAEKARAAELRSIYMADLAGGTERFFEKRRRDCPVCGGEDLRVWLRTTDLFQAKPGRFTLERCAACEHIFQNPRLSLAGLNFYYRDYYDGLGAVETEQAFEVVEAYRHRAGVVQGLAQPRRWLDVGAAYGHFCCYAKSMFPDTEFDGLDFGISIDEAVRTGWVNRGFRGLFPEVAPSLEGQYDVVSFYHYLEHVLDPAEEIRSAHRVLRRDGVLVIEVPNPECWFGRVFGKFWMPWVQPQHLNMLSPRNLNRVLRQGGFEPLLLEGTYVQQQFDIFIATLMFFKWLSPRMGMPWQPPPSPFRRLRLLAWVFALPALPAALVADLAFSPIARKLRIASAYRMVARRVDTSDPAVAARLGSESRELQFQ